MRAIGRCVVLLLGLAACGQSAPSGSAIGGACTSTADCQVGLTCQTDDPGGQCVKPCASDADCGPQAVCNGEHKCYRACASNADCTRGAPYACTTDATSKKFCDAVSPADGGGGDA
jgi:hypothetical protein